MSYTSSPPASIHSQEVPKLTILWPQAEDPQGHHWWTPGTGKDREFVEIQHSIFEEELACNNYQERFNICWLRTGWLLCFCLVFSWGPLCSAAESSRFEVSITIDMHAFVQRTPLKDVIQDGLKALLLIFYLVGRNPLLNWLSGGINRCWLVKRDWMILKNLLRSPKKSSPSKAGKHQPVAVWAHQVKYCPSRQQIPMR